jgi:hypothetical protein
LLAPEERVRKALVAVRAALSVVPWLKQETDGKMIFALGAYGHSAGRFYHDHPWLYRGMLVFLVGMTIWRKWGN